MKKRLGTRCSNKSIFVHFLEWLCSKGLTKVGEQGTFFVEGTIFILSGIGKMLITLDRVERVVLGRWGGVGHWLGGEGGLSLAGF